MFLTLAALLLLAVIAFQNYKYPQLRELTVSDGLYSSVPDHWMLDAVYVVLATTLALAFSGLGLAAILAYFAGGALLVTGASNTFSVWVDKVTNGLHNKIHSYLSIGMFLSMLGVQAVSDHGWLWYLSGAGIVVPGIVYAVSKPLKIAAFPAAEKAAIFFLCVWLIAWSNFR
jgi:hypothetical protein